MSLTLRMRVVLVCAGLASMVPAGPLAAQIPSAPSSSPSVALPRADVSAAVGWFSGTAERSEGSRPEGDSWYHDAASFSVHGGYYWTENVKLEASAAWGGTGQAWSGGEFRDPAGRPYYRSTEHAVTTRTVSAAVIYQFGHNLTLHPFVGAGIDVDFVRDRRFTTSYGDPLALYPSPFEERAERTEARLLVLLGVKAYVTERLFVRADVHAGGAGSARKVIPRIGLGIDF